MKIRIADKKWFAVSVRVDLDGRPVNPDIPLDNVADQPLPRERADDILLPNKSAYPFSFSRVQNGINIRIKSAVGKASDCFGKYPNHVMRSKLLVSPAGGEVNKNTKLRSR